MLYFIGGSAPQEPPLSPVSAHTVLRAPVLLRPGRVIHVEGGKVEGELDAIDVWIDPIYN